MRWSENNLHLLSTYYQGLWYTGIFNLDHKQNTIKQKLWARCYLAHFENHDSELKKQTKPKQNK